ncbi:hypothetical protein [Frondihabitans sucicola]|uniref:hypothetical protein n=1 Tax=Frondihabitans sucicola TaxID=1268041 RepID=UPI00257481FB|nr:hypothetical protein [Frondihabitans sucicola]
MSAQYQTPPGTPGSINIVGQCGANKFQAHYYGDATPLQGGWSAAIVHSYWIGSDGNRHEGSDYSFGKSFNKISDEVLPNAQGGIGYTMTNRMNLPAGVQGHTDSDTINAAYFLEAYQSGCTGATIEPTPPPYYTADGNVPIYYRSY